MPKRQLEIFQNVIGEKDHETQYLWVIAWVFHLRDKTKECQMSRCSHHQLTLGHSK